MGNSIDEFLNQPPQEGKLEKDGKRPSLTKGKKDWHKPEKKGKEKGKKKGGR